MLLSVPVSAKPCFSCRVRLTLACWPGLRSWFEFVELIYGFAKVESMALPPRLDDVLAWSNTFRCAGTFGNYLGYLRGACHALGYDAPVVGHPTIKRAMIAIVKRECFKSRQKMFINKYVLASVWAPGCACVLRVCAPGCS